MDSLEKLVSTQIRNRSTNTNVTAVTLRIPDEELISLDEVASELNMTRQDVLAQFVSYGISKAQAMIEKYDNHDMLNNGLAAAFWGDCKKNINKLRKGDRVFLYQNLVGIVATGIATGNTVVSDIKGDDGCLYPEKHSQKLDDFIRGFQISLRSCREVTKTNLPILRTMSRISEEQGKALLQEVERLKNQK